MNSQMEPRYKTCMTACMIECLSWVAHGIASVKLDQASRMQMQDRLSCRHGRSQSRKWKEFSRQETLCWWGAQLNVQRRMVHSGEG
jgi:hypothetical protein